MNDKEREDKILLVAPAEDANSAQWVTKEQAQFTRDLADRLGLIRNDQDGKLYIARPSTVKPVATQEKGDGIYYPSGAYLPRHEHNNHQDYAPGNPASAAPLIKGDPKTKLSKHFTLGEFAPKDPGYDGVRVHPDLVAVLEKIRAKVGATVTVTSGYRPPAYNRAVGGVPNSQHLDGLAADIFAPSLSTKRLCGIAEEIVRDQGGVGFYPRHGFVHVDVRGYRARWTG